MRAVLLINLFEYAESNELLNKENQGIRAKGKTIPCLTGDLVPKHIQVKGNKGAQMQTTFLFTSKETQKTKKDKGKCKE